MAKTIDELKEQSAEVKNATTVGENTATRVGTLFNDIVDFEAELKKQFLDSVLKKSKSELFNPMTIKYNVDILSTNGQETPSTQYSSSDFISIDPHLPLWVNSFKNRIFCYDENKQFIKSLDNVYGVAPSHISSDFDSTAYIRVIWKNEDIDTVRVGLTEKINYVADYFDFVEEPIFNEKPFDIISAGDLKNYVFRQKNNVLPINKDDFTIQSTEGRISFCLKAKKKAYVSVIITHLLKFLPNIRMFVEEYRNLYQYLNGYLKIATLSKGWTSSDVYGIVSNDCVLVIGLELKDGGILSDKQKKDIITFLTIKYNETFETSYYVSDWIKGDWTNSSNPTLTTRDYKLRNLDWLYLPQGTIIKGFLNGALRVTVDIWDAATGSAISIDEHKTEDFTIVLQQDSKILITTKQAQQNPVASDQLANILITTPNEKNQNNVTKLRIATFNVGDWSGDGIEAGSDEAKTVYRQILADINADIICTQEDTRYFNNTTKEPTKNALFSIFRNYYRTEKGLTYDTNTNMFGYCSNYDLSNINKVMYKFPYNTSRWNHHYFACAELIKDGMNILICNIHFDWDDNAIRAEQINQLLEYCSSYKNVIICGDTNPENYVNGAVVYPKYLYNEEWALFSAAGYYKANGGYFGLFNTCEDVGGWHPYDNIFTKGNIKISNVTTIEKDWQNDHRPVIADIVIFN